MRTPHARLAAGALLALGLAAAGAAPVAPTLAVPLRSDLNAAIGPAPGTTVAQALKFEGAGAEGCLRLPSPGKGPNGPLAAWPAAAFLNNAQGTLLFRVRCRDLADPKAKPAGLLRLSDPAGGAWTFALHETRYVKPESTDAPEMTGNPEGLTAETRPEKSPEPLDDQAEPVATLACLLTLRPFPENELAPAVSATRDVHEAGAWHEVRWSWCSVRQQIWIDGQPAAAAGATRTLSRLPPGSGEKATLELLSAGVDLADLRIYPRALAPGEEADAAPVRAWADWGWAVGRAVAYVDAGGLPDATLAQMTCVRVADGQPVAAPATTTLPNGVGECVLRLTAPEPLPPGTYRIDAVVRAADGRELGRAASAPFDVPKPDWPWLGFQGGRRTAARTKIVPPFTEIRVEGTRLDTVLAQHTLNRLGLFDQVRVAEGDLLAAPVTLDVRAGGQPLRFDIGPGCGAPAGTGDAATWAAESATADGAWSLRVAGRLEYDGVALFDLTLAPAAGKPARLDGVELRIPLRPEVARVAHLGHMLWFVGLERDAAGAWRTQHINWSGVKPGRQHRPDVLFDAEDLYQGLFPPPSRAHFAPFVNVGNYHRGLSWFADNDQGWVHAPGQVPTMEFVARGDETFLRLHIVARPVELTAPLRVRFGLLANPCKPLPADWRTFEIGSNQPGRNAVAAASQRLYWWHWSEYAESFHPYPGGKLGGKYEDWLGRFKGDRLWHCPFINFGTPGGFALWDEQMQVLPYTWKLHNTLPHQDYMNYWLGKCADEIGIRGVYIDEPYCEPWSYNVLAADSAWIRPDGTRELGFRFLEGREYIRRYKQLFTDKGSDCAVWVHTTNYRAFPVFTFADISMDGEHPSIWVPEFSNYHHFYCPERSAGYIAGAPLGMVGTMMFHSNTNPKDLQGVHLKCRTYLAVTWPYGVLPMRCSIAAEYDRIQNLRAALGFTAASTEELTMNEFATWLPGAGFEPAFRGVAGVRAAKARRALLFFSNNEHPRHTVTGDLGAALFPGQPGQLHAWNAETGAALRLGDKLEIELPPDDFAAVLVELRDTPQPPLERGILLAALNADAAPDIGAGLAPPTTTNARRADGALLVGPGQDPLGWPVVPNWAGGALQFTLRDAKPGPTPLRLARFAHHLDAELFLALRDGAPGLLLQAREMPAPEGVLAAQLYADGNPQKELVTLFAPLPPIAAADAGRRIVLTWECGRYALYCDGQPIGRLDHIAAPRLRDAAPPGECGFVLGHGGNASPGTGATLSDVTLYDWAAFTPDSFRDVPADVQEVPIRLLPGDGVPMALWAEVRGPRAFQAAVHYPFFPQPHRVESIRFSLCDLGRRDQPLVSVTTGPLHAAAYAWGWLALDNVAPAKPTASEGLLDDDPAGALDLDEGKGKPADEAGKTEYIVRCELLGSETDPETKKPRPVVLATQDITVTVDAVADADLPDGL